MNTLISMNRHCREYLSMIEIKCILTNVIGLRPYCLLRFPCRLIILVTHATPIKWNNMSARNLKLNLFIRSFFIGARYIKVKIFNNIKIFKYFFSFFKLISLIVKITNSYHSFHLRKIVSKTSSRILFLVIFNVTLNA